MKKLDDASRQEDQGSKTAEAAWFFLNPSSISLSADAVLMLPAPPMQRANTGVGARAAAAGAGAFPRVMLVGREGGGDGQEGGVALGPNAGGGEEDDDAELPPLAHAPIIRRAWSTGHPCVSAKLAFDPEYEELLRQAMEMSREHRVTFTGPELGPPLAETN